MEPEGIVSYMNGWLQIGNHGVDDLRQERNAMTELWMEGWGGGRIHTPTIDPDSGDPKVR